MTMDLSHESPAATAAEPSALGTPRSRRNILAAAVGALAGVATSLFGRPQAASAAAGDALLLGNTSNSAGTANTSLTTSSSGTALLVTQNGSGTALRGSAVGAGSIAGFFTANNGTGVSGVTGNASSYGVFASNDGAAGTGGALRASGANNHGIVATTLGVNQDAVRATHTGTAGVGAAVRAIGGHNTGVLATSTDQFAVRDITTGSVAIRGQSVDDTGVSGHSENWVGTGGSSVDGFGIWGHSENNYAGFFDGHAYVSQWLDMEEMSDPGLPGANQARLFVKDNGDGKTQLCVSFQTGSAIVLATEA